MSDTTTVAPDGTVTVHHSDGTVTVTYPKGVPQPTPTPQPGAAPPPPTPGAPTGALTPPTSAPTDPGITGTDIYGLTHDQEQWSIFTATTGGDHRTESVASRAHRYDPAPPPAGTALTAMTALDLMKKFAALGNGDLSTRQGRAGRQLWANMQRQLIAIKAYGQGATDKNVNLGQWTGQADSAALLRAIIGFQHAAGYDGAGLPLTFEGWLDAATKQQYANQQGGVAGGGSGSGLPSTPALTDPDTLKLAAQKAAQAALGRNLSAGELSNFVDQFHAEQTSAFQSALKGQGANVDKSDARASAINFVTSSNSQEFGQHQAQGYTDAFLNMFLSGPSAAPDMNVDPSAVTY